MENMKQKNHVIYVFICRYESNPKKVTGTVPKN